MYQNKISASNTLYNTFYFTINNLFVNEYINFTMENLIKEQKIMKG